MKRFVAKEDVEKGLFDPKKPLAQQPQYKKKLQEEAKKKQPKQVNEQSQSKQVKQKKPKKQRQDRPQYNWDKKQISLETPIPQTPKKILPKPDFQKFNADLKKLKEEKDKLFQQKGKLIQEQKYIIKTSGDNKKSGYSALSKYSGDLKQKNNLKNIIDGKIKKLQEQRTKVEAKIKDLKEVNGNLRNTKDLQLMSVEQLKQRIENLQHRLATANIDKKQEASINNDINTAKRALLKAKPEIQIKTQISKNDDSIKILLQQSKSLKKQLDANYGELKPLKKYIYDILQKRKQQQGTITEVRSFEEIRAEYDQKIKSVDVKRQDASKKMDDLRAKFNKQMDVYEDQQDLLRYIKYVQDERQYKLKRKQEDQRRQKQKQQTQKQKKKEFQDRQKRREERQKQDQERKQKQEQRKLKLQKQREDFVNRNPNWHRIQLCQFMIKYCENLKPENNLRNNNQDKNAVKAEDIKLDKHKGWEKQVKSGCQVIVSKKDKTEEQAPKKVKKQKKVKEQQQGLIHHTIDSVNRFHDLNVLPPQNVSELEQTIKQIRDKIEILSKPSEEEVAAFKLKAQAEFDRIHGFHEEKQHHETHEEQKASRHEKKRETSQKVRLEGTDFPELN